MSTHDDSKPKTGESHETDDRRLDPSKSIDYDRVHTLLEHFYELGKVDRGDAGVPPDPIAECIGASRETIRTILNESDRAERCWGIGPDTGQQRYSYVPADADDDEDTIPDGGLFDGVRRALDVGGSDGPEIPAEAVWETLSNEKRRFIIAKLFQEPRAVQRYELLKTVQKRVCPSSSFDSVSSTWVQTHRPLLLEYDLIDIDEDRDRHEHVTLTNRGHTLGEILATIDQRFQIVEATDLEESHRSGEQMAGDLSTDGGGEQEIVIVATNHHGSRSKFHTDPNCPYLKNIDNPQRMKRSHLFDDLEECQQCAGENTGGKPSGKSLADRIMDAHARGDDPEEELQADGGIEAEYMLAPRIQTQ